MLTIQMSFYGHLLSAIFAVIGILGLWNVMLMCITLLGSIVLSLYQSAILIYLTVVRFN